MTAMAKNFISSMKRAVNVIYDDDSNAMHPDRVYERCTVNESITNAIWQRYNCFMVAVFETARNVCSYSRWSGYSYYDQWGKTIQFADGSYARFEDPQNMWELPEEDGLKAIREAQRSFIHRYENDVTCRVGSDVYHAMQDVDNYWCLHKFDTEEEWAAYFNKENSILSDAEVIALVQNQQKAIRADIKAQAISNLKARGIKPTKAAVKEEMRRLNS